jgi:hypothetical protein
MNAVAERAMVRCVTGWQGDEGSQGAWGPQGARPGGSHGQNPYGGPPGGDPYGGSAGQDPYGTPYGQDPHYLQPDSYGGYQTGGFPAQGYGGFPPPPPPPRSRLPMIFGVLAIVLIVGAVVTIVLVNRDSGGTPTSAPSSTRPAPESTATVEPDPSSSSSPSSERPATRDGWQTVDNTADAGVIYEVPPEWKVVPEARDSGLGVEFTGTADFGAYECEGNGYVRSYVTSGDVQAKDGADLDLAKTVQDFAASFGKASFKETAQVAVPEPEELEVDGRTAVKLAAKVTPQVTVPACEATEGEIAIIGVLLEEDGEPTGVAMLVVVSDVAGGPADPKALPKSVAQEILASMTVG